MTANWMTMARSAGVVWLLRRLSADYAQSAPLPFRCPGRIWPCASHCLRPAGRSGRAPRGLRQGALHQVRVPHSDARWKRLFTAVYVPKDAAGGPYPFLMDRTPYSVGPYGEDRYPTHLGPSEEFQKSGYIFVYQDVRGRWMSEGEFVEMRPHIDEKKTPQDVDDASDTYDTIEFLLKHVANNNGKVGIWGISYPGFYTSASIIDSHPALVAASPQAPMTDLFLGDDAYHGGAFMLSANFGFYAFFHPQTERRRPSRQCPSILGLRTATSFISRREVWRTWRRVPEGLQLALQRPDEARHL